MEDLKNKYIGFILETKGVSHAYAEISAIYIGKLISFIRDKGITSMQDAAREHIDQYQQWVMELKLAIATKQSILSAAALFFRYLYDYGDIKENIGHVIELPRGEQRLPRNIMSEKEIQFLLTLPDQNDLMGIRDLCVMKLLYSSAMRSKEIFNLKLDDIDLRRRQAIVRRPKNKRDRIVHFDRYTAQILDNYIKKARPWCLRNRASDCLFISSTGSDLPASSWAVYFKNKYKPIMEKKFHKHITPYSFRHTSATHWLDSGARQKRDVLPYIQRQLGHESLESTAIYTHVAIEPLREMFKKYHPRDIELKTLHRIPSPEDIIGPLKGNHRRRR